ncbi:MAG: MauE/DoxX family redox-associated membrane protein, partial [Candidatus Eremiobacterota bacterium]
MTPRWASCLLGTLFLAAGLPKTQDLWAFAEAVDNYRILPGLLIGLSAAVLPWLEVVVGACLVSGVARVAAARLALAMLL